MDKNNSNHIEIKISDMSYSLYLNHMVFGDIILTLTLPIYKYTGYTFMFIFAVLIALVVSYCQHNYIEKPVMKFSRYLINKIEK